MLLHVKTLFFHGFPSGFGLQPLLQPCPSARPGREGGKASSDRPAGRKRRVRDGSPGRRRATAPFTTAGSRLAQGRQTRLALISNRIQKSWKQPPEIAILCVMKRDEVISRLQQHEAVLKKLGVEDLYLFGSTARGEAGDESDVDLFFDYQKGKLD